MNVPVTSTLPPSTPADEPWLRFWRAEAVLALIGGVTFVFGMANQETWHHWWFGEETEALVLEIQGPILNHEEFRYWVRVGDRGIWSFLDEVKWHRGDTVEVFIHPGDPATGQSAASVRRHVAGAVALGLLPIVGAPVVAWRAWRSARRAARVTQHPI